jgi:hypothetical protein
MRARRRLVLASSTALVALAMSAGVASAATTIWHVTAEGGAVKTRHRDDHTGDPKTNITVDDKQVYRGRIEFTLVITKDGDFTHKGFGTYSQASWHVEGTNGDKGAISCDPVEETNSPFDVDVSGFAHGGAVSLHMTLSAQETNVDTDCGAEFTAFGATTTYLSDSLAAVNGNHLRLTGSPIAPVLSKHTESDTETTHTSIDNEWHFTARCSGDCLPDPVKVRQQQKEAAEKAAAAYREALETDHAQVNTLCPAGGNRETPYACVLFEGKLFYHEAMLAEAEALAKDPSSHEFRKIARPHPLKLPRLPGRKRAASSELRSSYAHVGGLARALVMTINRAEGAALAANGGWTLRQNRAAGRFGKRLVVSLRRQNGLAGRARRELVHAGLLDSRKAASLTDSASRQAVAQMIHALKGLH